MLGDKINTNNQTFEKVFLKFLNFWLSKLRQARSIKGLGHIRITENCWFCHVCSFVQVWITSVNIYVTRVITNQTFRRCINKLLITTKDRRIAMTKAYLSKLCAQLSKNNQALTSLLAFIFLYFLYNLEEKKSFSLLVYKYSTSLTATYNKL
jgi:hypothetical protein